MQLDLDTNNHPHITMQNVQTTQEIRKLSAISDMKQQIVCAIKIRHFQRHDRIDFAPLLQKANEIIPIDTVVADK
jgi:hypothetical protein